MRRGHKGRVDRNHGEIVKALRKVGATVQSIAECGHGCPDILAGYHSVNYVLEVKDEDGELTDAEYKWQGDWRGQCCTVYTVNEALRAIGAIR